MVFLSYDYKKMGGNLVGLDLIGKGLKEKQAPLSTPQESGMETQMTKVLFLSLSIVAYWIYGLEGSVMGSFRLYYISSSSVISDLSIEQRQKMSSGLS